MASKEFRAIIPKAAATDNIRGLLLKDHDLLYKRLSSVKLTYSHGNAAGNFLEANRATGEDKETSWQSRRRPRAGRVDDSEGRAEDETTSGKIKYYLREVQQGWPQGGRLPRRRRCGKVVG
jgi:hypothetical protein